MKIATLQFSPQLGQVTSNIARADALLSASPLTDVNLLVLPELAFTGYNHTLESILPHLEPTVAGISTKWAKSVAAKYDCIVTVGYPELASPSPDNDQSNDGSIVKPLAYNSTITVSSTGEVLAHYRKTHLYYTDEPWATEGPEGWLVRDLPLPIGTSTIDLNSDNKARRAKAAFGICMDLNPRKFLAPWDAYEFCTSALSAKADILVLSMAWLTSFPSELVCGDEERGKPDMDTFTYWLNRLTPLVEGEGEVLVVCANRCGEEPGQNPCGQLEEGVRYAGTSWVGRIGRGKVGVWGILGRAEEGVLVCDTEGAMRGEFRMVRKEADYINGEER